MVFGMATRKVTVTLPAEQVDAIKEAVSLGRSSSVSGFVQHAVALALDEMAAWDGVLAHARRETGGPLTDDERRWADSVLGPPEPGSAA